MTELDPAVRTRAIELANEIMVLDRRYHARVAWLKSKGTQDYHLDNDLLLKYISGGTKVLSDMATALALVYILVNGDPPRE